MKPRIPKLTAILFILVLAVPLFLVPSAAAPTAQARMGDVKTAGDAYASKIHPKLQAAVAAAAALTEDIDILVYAKKGTDLSRYMDNLLVRPYVLPNGTQAYFGRAKVALVAKIASLPEVAAVQEMKSPFDRPMLPEGPTPRAEPNWEALRGRLAQLKAGGAKATVNRPAADLARIADWFDVTDPHKSKAAWALGYTGQGVKVMVNDSGIDFAHPDLQGTVARDTDPASPYYGWPIGFDSFSMLVLAYDYYHDTSYIADGMYAGGVPDYADTRTTRSGTELDDNGDGTLSASFAPIGSTAPGGHIYTFKATSKSGVYHFGSHPDSTLEYLLDERAAVLVVDENTAGVYDTVYVDLDGDYDFTSEKRVVKGDETVYKDLDGDGYADISGGLVYWISDGANPLPASDWLWGMKADVASPGDLVAFSISDALNSNEGDHGQLCASSVAGQGVIDGGAPAWKPAGDGTPGTGMLQGPGKDARLIATGDYYFVYESLEPYVFAALGYDGLAGTDDDVQLVSDSHGHSSTDNDGWDYYSRSLDMILRYLNPSLSDVNAAGNGAAGYGTNTSPAPALGISVGASTQFDSMDQFDSLATLDQMQYNDAMSWSGRGPSAVGENGIHVMANGAFGAGALPLNLTLDGWNSWDVFGGTSEATPKTAGNLALVYQAFKAKHGRWPTNVEARAILMAGADDIYNDGFVQGAGTVNAVRSVKIAAGLGGVYIMPDSVTFGDYRGTQYEAFTSIMHPGQTAAQEFTVYNPGSADVTVNISDDQLVRIGQKEIDLTTVDQTLETANFYMPDYLIDIKPYIPAGTELMEVKLAQPFAEFDPDGNYAADSSWRVAPTDWTDINGDGKLWEDKNGNGAINCPIAFDVLKPDYAAATCEIQQGEYMRFGYGYDRGTTSEQRVKMPLERMHDGIFVALSHRSKSAMVPITHLKVQLNFYKAVDFPWLTADKTVTVPAGGKSTFKATMAVPALANVGLYEAMIRVDDGTNIVNVPVVANVAAFSTDFLFGGPPETMTPYDNGMVNGYFDWSWRAESGDWRFYFVDVPDSTPAGTNLLVDTRWTGASTDIDTLIMGPQQDCFSNGVGCEFPFSTFPGAQDVYGPYTLEMMGGSPQTNIGAGRWLYDTSTGGPREIVAAPTTPGLNLIALHNVMYDGSQPQERFTGQVGTITATPDAVDLYVGNATSGSFPMTIKSSLSLAGALAEGFGMSVPDVRKGLPQKQDDPNDPSTSSYKIPVSIKHGARLDASITGSDGDLDLFLLYDFNSDGVFDFGNEVIGSSAGSTANESISVVMPLDGDYEVAVHGWDAAATTFDLTINAVQGESLKTGALPAGPYQPNTPIPVNVDWKLAQPLVAGEAAQGAIVTGPTGAPAAMQIPVRLHNIGTPASATFSALGDAYIHSGAPTTNYGTAPYLHTRVAVSGLDYLRSLLAFDVSSIKPEYPVEKAELSVYLDATSGGAVDGQLQAHEVTTAWAENAATWNAPWVKPGGDYDEAAAGAVGINKGMVGKWITLDVTPLVAKWVADPASNHGLMLRLRKVSSITGYRFVASENWAPELAPKLTVTYWK